MPPRRKRDAHLPPGLYFKHGAYYFVARNTWHRLGTDLRQIIMEGHNIKLRVPLGQGEIVAYAQQLVAKAKQNARARSIPFSLNRDDAEAMLHASNWKCAVTKMPFSLEQIAGRRPFAPSIDRIDSTLGYTPENCRVVCVAVNLGMNVWGDVFYRRLLRQATKTA